MERQHDAVKFNSIPFEILTDCQKREIHETTLRVLQEVGVIVHHEGAVKLLADAGATVEDAGDSITGKRVYITPAMVEGAIRSAPSLVNVYDRNGELAMALGGRNVYFGTGSDCPNTFDYRTGERRLSAFQDVVEGVMVCDALKYIDFIMSMGLIQDRNIDYCYQEEYAIMLKYSTKPQVITAGDMESLDDIVELAAAAVGGMDKLRAKPIFVLYNEPSSPLQHTKTALDKLLYMAENYLPTNHAPGMMAGATGPITLAGAIVTANAETLSGLVIHQLKRPGAPFVYGGGMSNLDMGSMQPTYTSPEAVMSQYGFVSMGQYYNLPVWGFAGCSSSKVPDEQAVLESAIFNTMVAIMGCSLSHDVGYLEFGLTFSLESLVMNDEMIAFIRRMMDGVKVDKTELAFEAIKRVGPGGNFLEDDHTFENYKKNFTGSLSDRSTHEQWANRGSKTMRERARIRIDDILKNHTPPFPPQDALDKIDAILEKVKSRPNKLGG